VSETRQRGPGSRIGLGTVQFGLDYGITNSAGQVGTSEAAAILALAADRGIDTLDTAHGYGESEQVIGRCWPTDAKFRVVTKTPHLGSVRDANQAADQLRSAFASSLQALGQPAIYGLLLHDAQDLLSPFGNALWSAMQGLKAEGKVTKLGVSSYEPDEVDQVLDAFPIDLIQVPFNAIDRRLIDGGQLERLERAGVEVHARSLFLQGLLLASEVPDKFAPVQSAALQLDESFGRHGLSRLEGLLGAALGRAEIDRLIVGVTSAQELSAILSAAERAAVAPPVDLDLPWIDPRFLNPARWGDLG
jgi:aryl-alcohol dehydrogenase-like predicted oxidoreductase